MIQKKLDYKIHVEILMHLDPLAFSIDITHARRTVFDNRLSRQYPRRRTQSGTLIHFVEQSRKNVELLPKKSDRFWAEIGSLFHKLGSRVQKMWNSFSKSETGTMNTDKNCHTQVISSCGTAYHFKLHITSCRPSHESLFWIAVRYSNHIWLHMVHQLSSWTPAYCTKSAAWRLQQKHRETSLSND